MGSIDDWLLLNAIKAEMYLEREPKEGSSEEGSTTVEYAIGAVATAAFAGLLLAVLKSGSVKGMITNIIQTALSI